MLPQVPLRYFFALYERWPHPKVLEHLGEGGNEQGESDDTEVCWHQQAGQHYVDGYLKAAATKLGGQPPHDGGAGPAG